MSKQEYTSGQMWFCLFIALGFALWIIFGGDEVTTLRLVIGVPFIGFLVLAGFGIVQEGGKPTGTAIEGHRHEDASSARAYDEYDEDDEDDIFVSDYDRGPRREYDRRKGKVPTQRRPRDGKRVRHSGVTVAGAFYRRDAAMDFGDTVLMELARGRIDLEPDPTNPNDRNAIRTIGILTGNDDERRLHIGYVPREIAGQIADDGAQIAALSTNLKYISIAECIGEPDRTYIDIRFDILEPRP